MIFYSQNKKKGLYGVVLLILCAFILVLTATTARASNPYTSNIQFYQDGGDLFIKFYVNTTYSTMRLGKWNDNAQHTITLSTYCLPIASYISPEPSCVVYSPPYMTCTFEAGNTYTINANGLFRDGGTTCYTLASYTGIFGAPNSTHFFRYEGYILGGDYEFYYYEEFPTLDIDFPLPNAEISGAFYITGSYTLPASSTFDTLLAMVNEPGIYDATYYGFFQTNLPPDWWDVDIRVAGVPAGEYEIFFAFMDYDDPDNIYISSVSIPITIVVGSPSEFEPGEIPPSMFNILDPDSYYTANSNYASSTLVFDNLSGAVKPVILKIGDYLVFFSSKFDDEIAKETGEAMAGGVLIVRAYADNLNTFFGDLPISQALFFYLLLLVVVAVFRIVKNLINLIKP